MKDFYAKYFKYIFFAFALFLPLNEKVSTLLIVLLVILTIVGLSFNNLSLNKEKNAVLLLLPILFAVYGISLFFVSEHIEFKYLENKLSLLAFPIILAVRQDVDRIGILRFFVFGCILAYLICLGNSFFNAIVLESGNFRFNPLNNDSRTFFEAIMYEGNVFFGKYFSFIYHQTYFAVYLSFSFLILNVYKRMFCKWQILLGNIIFPLGVIQTMSMAGFGTLLIVVFALLFLNPYVHRLKMILFGIFLAALIAGISIHPRIQKLVRDLRMNETLIKPNAMDGIMLRVLSWDASIEIIKNHPITGVGVGDSQKALNEVYKDKKYIHPLERNLNAHNQYLQIMIETGIFGLLTLVLILTALFYRAATISGPLKIIIFSFVIMLAFNFLFESILSRYIGISFFAFFSCLLSNMPQKTTDFEKAPNK
ncbi:O-antigen ligase [Flagellimonas taeanensis]|uniref:O-antigen ligase n=2 Tax=Flagellimonas taeanensis TaxID=1005926 RepID=A0A1M6QCT1_9FLAO|nr:O-antigen ligase [Allomuricauda taeanensis]SHK17975.1 O-antigen ligase [Allomuricauda taeanensis]